MNKLRALWLAVLGLAWLVVSPGEALAVSVQGFHSERLSVVTQGQGPDVVLIPGLASSRHVWDDLVAQLSITHKVHLVQLAGFAGEPWGQPGEAFLQPVVEELARYIQTENLHAPAIIGHSLGGLCALMLAQAYPEAVGRVMTVDSLPFYSGLFGAQTVEDARPYAERAAAEMLSLDEATFDQRQQMVAQGMTHNPAMQARILEWSKASDRKAVAVALREVMLADVRPGLAGMKMPVTALYADAGRPVEEVDAVWKAQYLNLQGVKLVRVQGSYHFIMADRPQAFSEQVAAFLKTPEI